MYSPSSFRNLYLWCAEIINYPMVSFALALTFLMTKKNKVTIGNIKK